MIFALYIWVYLKSLYQPCSQLNIPGLTGHIEWSLFPYGCLIQLETLLYQEFHNLNIIGLAGIKHCLFHVQHVYGRWRCDIAEKQSLENVRNIEAILTSIKPSA